MPSIQTGRYLSYRPTILGLTRSLFLTLGQLPAIQAAPVHASTLIFGKQDGTGTEDPSLWLYLGVAAFLVLLGGAFAGLTIALMGQDEIYLQVIKTSGEGAERKHAAKVLKLLSKGKHWVLVTLLLGNVITNETLPIILDRSLGGGWPAVLGSTVLIVIFGEIAPQSVCVRYGLPIGSWMAPFVLVLMYALAPIAWPTAKLLDYLLGEDHGTVYKKAGLKTLVSLHRSLGETGQQLNADEVTIISAVLDLKDKSIGSIMTPMEDVFTLSLDDVLDEETMDVLLTQGYSRIPIYHPDNDENFVGMLLVKMLITYDPEDAKPVREFALATLPETSPHTSCLDIVNFFQEGKSHMVLVSDDPGGDHGALGVVTLEDVIEELIGEEIIDESDVFIDVHKALRRLAPAPRVRIPKPNVMTDVSATTTAPVDLVDINEGQQLTPNDLQRFKTADGLIGKQKLASHTRRRSSANSNLGEFKPSKRASTDEIREHLKHLGPSNLASRPKTTRYNTVKIKPGNDSTSLPKPAATTERMTVDRRISENASEYQGGVGEELLVSGGKVASDGVKAVQQQHSHGSIGSPNTDRRPPSIDKGSQVDIPPYLDIGDDQNEEDVSGSRERGKTLSNQRSRSHSTLGSLRNNKNTGARSPNFMTQGSVRSGSITENIVDSNGIRKVVLETTSSSSNEDDENSGANKGSQRHDKKSSSGGSGAPSHVSLRGGASHGDVENHGTSKKKKKRRKKHGQGRGESDPLLG